MTHRPFPETWTFRVPRVVYLLAFFLLAVRPLEAARYRVVDENGKPVPAARVSIQGRAGSVAADAQGELRLDAEPALPFEVGIFAPSGAWLGIVRVESRLPGDAVRDLVLPAARSTEVFVSAGTAASLLAPPANPVSLVSKRELDERQPSRLSDTVDTLPGISKSDESTSSVPVVRGLSRGRTLLMIDDGRVSAERRAGASASFLNPFALESVEIVRGPGSVAYGSDAFGGVIQAKTSMPTPGELSGRYTLAAGTGGTPEAAGGASVNVPAGPGAFSLALYQRSQSDYESPEGTQDNSSVRDRGFVLRGLVPVGEARLWAGFQLDQVRDMGKPQADLPTTRTFYPSEDSSRFTLGLDVPGVAGFSSVELRAFYGAYGIATNRQRVPNATTTLRNTISDVDANDFSVRLLARRSLGTAGVRVGFDVNGRSGLTALNIVESFDSAGNPTARTTEVAVEDASRTDWGAFAESDVPLAGERLMLTAGLRADHVSTQNTGGYFGDLSTSDSALSGFATLAFTFSPEWKAVAQYSRGFRDPTLSDRYFRGVSGRGFVTGNPDLVAETSNQWDLSVHGRTGPVNVGLSGYLYRIQDLVERYKVGDNFFFRNRGEAEIQGVELEADVRLAPRLVVRVAGALAQGRILDDGTWAPDIAPPTAQVVVDHAPLAGLFWRARFVAVARDEKPGASEVAVAGYGRLDLSAGVRVSSLLTVTVSARNLFDQAYADSADELHVVAPGRGAILTLAGSF
ncbi:MAG: TonB-dependent receptor [Holophagales bacterium]|nr:TonB-dependent receptor [Holophagales bacterium]